MTRDWIADVRTSYDTVAAGYAEQVRGAIEADPYMKASLALFAELVQGGPVADVGCGPGHVTRYLCGLGLDAFGIDLSPAMVELARRDHPGVRFEVGSMTALDLPDGSLAGLLSWWSLVHVPDEALPGIYAEFHRTVRPGGVAALGFHAGEGARLKTEGYGGLPMQVYVHRRDPAAVADGLRAAGFAIEADLRFAGGAVLTARRS